MDNIDFSEFSQDDFDPVKWLNAIFSSENENEALNSNGRVESALNAKEMIATNLVYKLQLMVEETNNSLEDIAQRMALSIPKVVGEAEVLNREATELCSEVIDVRTKMICAVQQSSEAVDTLIHLDQAKHRFQETYKALQEANNWTTLTMDVEEVFESGDTDQIAAKLVSMQKSLEVLSLSPSFENQHQDKMNILEALKDRFEKLIEPVLMESFLNQSSQSIEFYSKLFKDLHRSDRLITYYHHCLRNQLLKEWTTQVKLDSEETLLNWLNFLYDRLAAIWKTQMNFCMKVLYPDDFSRSLKILCDIYTDIVMSLDPTIEFCFDQYLQRCLQSSATAGGDTARLSRQKALIELKQFTNSFMRSIEQNIVNQYCGVENINEFIPRVSSFDIFIRTIYRPFATFNDIFLQLEKDRLMAEFEEIKAKFSENTNMVVSSECIIKLFVVARNSLKLYSQYVQSYPILVVDCAIEQFLLRFFAEFRSYLQENIKCHLESKDASPANATKSTASSHRRTNSTGGGISKLKTSGSNSSIHGSSVISPNWQVIQQALFSFQIVGEFFMQLEKFQQQIHLTLDENQKRLDDAAGINFDLQKPSPDAIQHESNVSSSISYFNRFDIFILNLDSNLELRDQIENHLLSPPPSSNILSKVRSECIKAARSSGQAICESILHYAHLYLSSFFATLRFQMQQSNALNQDGGNGAQGDDDDDELSFSPNEYITQIGQYLLTLPQHLEPFNPNENAAMKTALKYSVDVFTGDGTDAAVTSRLSKLTIADANSHPQKERIDTATTEFLLDSILRLTTRAFLEQLLKLVSVPSNMTAGTAAAAAVSGKLKRKLPASVRKQIAVDLSYLVAVCEDLGLTSNDPQFLLLVHVFNEVHSRESFQQVLQQNSAHSKMLKALEEMLTF